MQQMKVITLKCAKCVRLQVGRRQQFNLCVISEAPQLEWQSDNELF
jgi:hypothetical protein